MPVLPEFMPEGRPGEAADAFAQGRTEGESWMTMEQQRQIAAQQAQQQHDQFVAQLPAIHAKAQADVATANAAINLSTRMQQLRTQAGVVAPSANNEFLDAMQLADPQSQFDELGTIQAKYAWLKNLDEYKPFLDAVDKARGDAFHLVTANNLADATLERTKALVGAKQEQIETQQTGATDRANIIAGAKVQSAQIAGQSREQAAETSATGRVEAAKARAGRAYELEVTMAKRDDAIEAGDMEVAQIYQDRLNKLNATSEGSPNRPLPTTGHKKQAAQPSSGITPITVPGITPTEDNNQPASVTPAPVKIPKGSAFPPTVTIEGKKYPVYKDKNGNAAYLRDGQYFEITDPSVQATK